MITILAVVARFVVIYYTVNAMDNLPDEMLGMIFKLLTTREVLSGPARVCRRWKRVGNSRILVIKSGRDVGKLRAALHSIFIRTRITSLNDFLDKTADVCTHLRELTVHSMMLFRSCHFNALSRMRLRHLDVFIHGRMCDKVMLPVARELQTLVLNESVAPGFLADLSKRSQFESLQMFGRAMYYPRAEMLALLVCRGVYLTELTLRCPELTHTAYEVIGNCVNLTSLQLYSCWMMTAGASLNVVRPPKLRRLHLTGTFMVRTISLKNLISQMPVGLQELVLSSSCFSNDHISVLTSRLMNLRLLELWRCKLGARGVIRLAEEATSLEDLDLDIELTKSDLQKIAKTSNLKRLRCRPKLDSKDGTSRLDYPVMYHNLKISSSYARYAGKYFRGGGEGFRANLFYYSTQDTELEVLPPNTQPAWFDDNPYF